MKVKAKPKEKPRVVKTWRLDGDILKQLSSYCKRKKQPESEIVESALYDYLTK